MSENTLLHHGLDENDFQPDITDGNVNQWHNIDYDYPESNLFMWSDTSVESNRASLFMGCCHEPN